MTQLAEIVVTTDQATLLGAAADVALRANADEQFIQLEEDEVELLQQLVIFMALVASEPSRFPVVGRMAATIRDKARGMKGPAQPKGTNHSTRNKRKARQESRIGFAKRRRQERREITESFNEAREIMEREMKEAQEIQEQRQAEIAVEPKFEITDIMGNVVFTGVPESMIRPVIASDEDAQAHANQLLAEARAEVAAEQSKIVMPGSAEAIQAQLDHKNA